MSEVKTRKTFTNRIYDTVKIIALIVLPAFGTLYFALAQFWGWPYGEEVVGSIVAFDAFLGVVVQTSRSRYYKKGKNFDGDINVIPDEDGSNRIQFAFEKDPREVIEDDPGKHTFEYRVNKLKGGSDGA